jgi:chromosome segregation ATPase
MESVSALLGSNLPISIVVVFFLLILFGRDLVDGIKWMINKMGAKRVQTISMKLDKESDKISNLQKEIDVVKKDVKTTDEKINSVSQEISIIGNNILGTDNIKEIIEQTANHIDELSKQRKEDSNQQIKNLKEWGSELAKELRGQSIESINKLFELYSKLSISQEGTQLMVVMNLYMSRGRISSSELLKLENAMNEYLKVGNHHCENLFNEFKYMIECKEISITKEKIIK